MDDFPTSNDDMNREDNTFNSKPYSHYLVDIQITSLPDIVFAGLFDPYSLPTVETIDLPKSLLSQSLEFRICIYDLKGHYQKMVCYTAAPTESNLKQALQEIPLTILESLDK